MGTGGLTIPQGVAGDRLPWGGEGQGGGGEGTNGHHLLDGILKPSHPSMALVDPVPLFVG